MRCSHPALPSSPDDKALAWPRVADAGSVGSDKGVQDPPIGAVLLEASPKGTQQFALVYELPQAASRNGVVAAVDNSPLGRLVPVVVPPHAQGLIDPPQGARLRDGLRPTLNLPFLVCSQKCVMPRKSNVLPTLPAVRSGKPTELDDCPGAVQAGQSLPKVPALRITQMLKAAHEVVRIADNDRVSHPLAPVVLEPVVRSAGSQGMAIRRPERKR